MCNLWYQHKTYFRTVHKSITKQCSQACLKAECKQMTPYHVNRKILTPGRPKAHEYLLFPSKISLGFSFLYFTMNLMIEPESLEQYMG